MPRQDFFKIVQKEVARIDAASVTKRKEHLIAGFTQEASPKAIIDVNLIGFLIPMII
jgi:hypothetical protein